MLNWLQMKAVCSHSSPLCLGSRVQRQSQAGTGTLKWSPWVLFGNPFIHIKCQQEGMHGNEDFYYNQRHSPALGEVIEK